MIRVEMVLTGKNYGSSSQYSTFGDDFFCADSVEDAIVELKTRYGNSWNHRKKMYRDTKNGTIHCGWIVGFKNADLSHSPVDRWLQRDWIELVKCTPINLEAK